MEGKRLSLTQAVDVRRRAREEGRSVVFTNGCFDLLHEGHIYCLRAASEFGDHLIVGLNSDASVRRLKGSDRPVHPLDRRVSDLAALDAVDVIVVFEEDTPLAVIDALKPDVLVKGGDYTPDRIVGRDVVEAYGGRVETAPYLEGHSTTERLARRP